jgi:hypothetical protein
MCAFRVDGVALRVRRPAQAQEDREAQHRRRDRPPEGALRCRPGRAAQQRQRLAESFEAALRIADGRALVVELDAPAPEIRRRCAGRALLQRQVRLPGVQLFDHRARAAAVLVQLADGRLPALRRHRHDGVLRPGAGGGLPDPEPGQRRHQGLGPAQRLLLRHAGEPGQTLPLRHRGTVRAPAAGGARRGAARLGRRRDQVQLRDGVRRVQRQEAHPQTPVRGHPAQHGAALPRDRFGGGARGPGALPQHPALPGVPVARGCAARRAT